MSGLAFGLGWMHACDRQLQSLLMVIGFKGRISELAKGEELLEIDKQMRKLNIVPDLENEILRLDPEIRRQLQAYADGYNAYMENGKKNDEDESKPPSSAPDLNFAKTTIPFFDQTAAKHSLPVHH